VKEIVSDVIAIRAHDPRGLSRMITWSFAIHVTGLVLVAVLPRTWLFRPAPQPRIMTISLGGTPGPRSTGMTPVGGRTVEEVAPEPKRPTPIAPAAPKPDVMTVPDKAPVKPKPEAKTTETTLPPSPTPRPPTTGKQVTRGSAVIETGATGQAAGLTVGGGGGGAQLTVESDFCCPGYLQEVMDRISAVWRKVQPEHGTTIMVFTIKRDGTIVDIQTERSSGSSFLDRESMATLRNSALRLRPLPGEYPADHLTIHLSFPY
jgi:outer membrane biosynthesis protein TonB